MHIKRKNDRVLLRRRIGGIYHTIASRALPLDPDTLSSELTPSELAQVQRWLRRQTVDGRPVSAPTCTMATQMVGVHLATILAAFDAAADQLIAAATQLRRQSEHRKRIRQSIRRLTRRLPTDGHPDEEPLVILDDPLEGAA